MNLLIPFEEMNEELLERVEERLTSFGKVSITDIERRDRAHKVYILYIYICYMLYIVFSVQRRTRFSRWNFVISAVIKNRDSKLGIKFSAY